MSNIKNWFILLLLFTLYTCNKNTNQLTNDASYTTFEMDKRSWESDNYRKELIAKTKVLIKDKKDIEYSLEELLELIKNGNKYKAIKNELDPTEIYSLGYDTVKVKRVLILKKID